DHDLVNQRFTEPAHLDPRPALDNPRVILPDRSLPAARGGPDADHRARVRGVGWVESIPGYIRLRDLEGNRVDVEAFRAVDVGRRWRRDKVELLERPPRPEGKDRSQVDVEAFSPLTRERLHPP